MKVSANCVKTALIYAHRFVSVWGDVDAPHAHIMFHHMTMAYLALHNNARNRGPDFDALVTSLIRMSAEDFRGWLMLVQVESLAAPRT